MSADATLEDGSTHAADGDGAGSSPLTARLVLLAGILSGFAGVVATPFVGPEQLMLASDVYFYAADALRSGGDIYEVTPPERPGYHYIYPPVVVFAFLPHALLGSPAAAYALQTLLNVVFAAGIAAVIWRALTRRGVALTRLDAALVFSFALCSAHSAISLINGQVNIALAFAFALGFDALDRGRHRLAGAAFAAAALVKVFPAAIGLWLLRVRAWRSVTTAIGVGLAGLLVGLLALGPEPTVTYFTEVLTGRYDGFDGAPEPTQGRDGAQRQIAALTGLGEPYVTPLAVLALAPVLAYVYLDVGSDRKRQAAILATVLVTLLFFPLQRLYMVLFVFPFVVLLYTLPPGRPRALLVAGALISFLRIEYQVVAATVAVVSIPDPVAAGVLAASEPLFQAILPPTLGMWLLLGACVLVQYEDG